MRLGQLSRKLNVKPTEIVSFLEKNGVILNAHPNSKVEDGLIDKIEGHFTPVTSKVEKEAIVEEVENKKEEVPQPKTEDKTAIVQEPEVIETVKPEAQELKIIGKIDLPDTSKIQVEVDGVVYDQATLDNKKKEKVAAEREQKAVEKEKKRKEEQEKKRIALEKRKVEEERQAMLAREKNNLLTAEEEKKKAAIIKAQQERERKLEEKRKQQQKEHYLKNVATKNISSTSKKKKTKQPTDKIENKTTENIVPEQKVQLNAFQKFIKWLNT